MRQAILTIMLAGAMFVPAGYGQDDDGERLTIDFSDPARPGLVRLNLILANVVVRGYDGDVVQLQARGGIELPIPPARPGGRGQRRAPAAPRPFIVREANNVITIGARRPGMEVELQVPRRTSLSLNGATGDIEVEGVYGRLTINTQTGNVTVRDVRGSAEIRTLAGDLECEVVSTRLSGPMTLESLTGTILAVLPTDVGASLRVESQMGGITTDFELESMAARRPRRGRSPPRRMFVSDLNGGGPTVQIRSTLGEIVIRRMDD